ncbi:MAG: FmdB family zinc ribbon protein [Gemmatimonadota bacterium]
MPTYEYECRACGHRFERFQHINDRVIRTCPECGKRSVRRLISAGGGIVFKGPGFYATDYRKGPAPSRDGGRGKKESPDAGSGAEGGASPSADAAKGSSGSDGE